MSAEGSRRTQETRSHYVYSEQVGFLLRRAYQRHIAIFQASTSAWDVTSVQFSTLCALKDGGSHSQGELVKATGVDQATIRGIIDRLKARGLVALSKDREDGRKVIVSLTGEGLALVEQVIERAIEVSELTLGALNPGERAALLFTLRRMLEDQEC